MTPACPLGESIWNQGQSDLDSSGKDKLNWGMAINPIFRRGQHQMHIHLAEVQPTLIDNIKYGFGKENRTSFYLNCGLSDTKRTMEGCKVLPVGSKPDRHTPHVSLDCCVLIVSSLERNGSSPQAFFLSIHLALHTQTLWDSWGLF